MFIELESKNGEKIFINFDHVREMRLEKFPNEEPMTRLEFNKGRGKDINSLVIETPEVIFQFIKDLTPGNNPNE